MRTSYCSNVCNLTTLWCHEQGAERRGGTNLLQRQPARCTNCNQVHQERRRAPAWLWGPKLLVCGKISESLPIQLPCAHHGQGQANLLLSLNSCAAGREGHQHARLPRASTISLQPVYNKLAISQQ